MRLIDADKFKEYIADGFEQNEDLFTDEQRDFVKVITWGFLKDINEQPTAYDIDEIVEKLEENYSCDVGNLKMISVDKAIEIVKGGAK